MPRQRLRHRRPDRARRTAYRILRAVTAEGAYANLETARVLRTAGLDARDAAFVTELVAGTCRLQGTYDAVLQAASGRDGFDADVRDALRLGSHQLLSMRVPPRAAIAATVDLAGAEIGERVVGVTNAVLRKVAATDLAGWVDRLSSDADDIGRLALRTHHPRWIAEVYTDLLGVDAEQALAANNVPPVTNLVVRPGRATVAELEGAPDRFSPFGACRPGNPADVPAVAQGRAGVQDEGSQLVAWALTRPEAPGGSWLDLCAGPGGKAALLAGLAIEQGRTLVANEVQPHRAELVASALSGYGDGSGAPTVVVGDGTAGQLPERDFARVMVDVPCTGLGALRRRPESRWRRSAADVAALVRLQRRLLDAALDAAAVGGLVAYVTCSPHPAETTEVVAAVTAARSDVEVWPASTALPEVPDSARGSAVQLWPHRHGTDAMFLALLRRR